MPRHTGFVSTLTTVFSQTSLNMPTPVPVNYSTTSLHSLPDFRSIGRPRSSNSLTTTITSSASSVSSSESGKSRKSVRKAKKLYKMLKKHKDVWWISGKDKRKGPYQVYQNQTAVQAMGAHEMSYMYFM